MKESVKETIKEEKKKTKKVYEKEKSPKNKSESKKRREAEAERQRAKKKKIIIISVVAAVVIVAGIILGIHFSKENKNIHETTYSDTFKDFTSKSASNVEFTYTCPYFEKAPQFYVEDTKGFYMTYVDANGKTVTINGEIVGIKYNTSVLQGSQGETRGGTLTLEINLDKKLLKEETTYRAVLKAGSISYKDDDYVNKEISAEVKAASTDGVVWDGDVIPFADAKTVVPSNVEINLTKDSNKGYFSIKAYIPGVTQYNEAGTKNFEALAKIEYKNENGRFIRFISTDVEFKAENGNVFLKGSIGLEDLIPGEDYTVTIQKGVFVNDDKSVINDEYVCTYTYVE